MSQTIPAIFENGIIRPLEELELTNGEKIDVILLKRQDADPERSREILFEIAELPIEGEMAGFSGRDHDEILYPTS